MCFRDRGGKLVGVFHAKGVAGQARRRREEPGRKGKRVNVAQNKRS